MSKKLMISMLTKGENGNEILAILDAITASDSVEDQSFGTLKEIEF